MFQYQVIAKIPVIGKNAGFYHRSRTLENARKQANRYKWNLNVTNVSIRDMYGNIVEIVKE